MNVHRMDGPDLWESDLSIQKCIMAVFRSQWFTCAWVLQEIVQASRIIFRYEGTNIIWPKIMWLAESIDGEAWEVSEEVEFCLQSARLILPLETWRQKRTSHAAIPDDANPTLDPFEWKHRRGKAFIQLEDAIYKVRDAQCTEPKDKIFPAPSLVPSGDGGLIFFPDYRLSAMEIQNMLAKSSMLEYRSLNVLRYVEQTTKKISMPLWAPRLIAITKLSESWTEGNNHYEQDVKTEVSFKSQNSQGTEVLCLRGTIMLEVSRVSSGRVTLYDSSSLRWPRIGLEDDDVEAFKQYQVRRDTLPSTISGRRLVNESFYGARSALDDDGDYLDP